MELKTCTKCGEIKTLDNYYSTTKHSNKKGEYTYYLPRCRDCLKEQGKEYREESEESYRKALKRYQQSEKGKRKHRERGRRQRERGYFKEYQKQNKDKFVQYQMFRVMNKEHDITDLQWVLCKDYFDYECAYCGITEEESKKKYKQRLHKEHAIHDGANDISNCVPACKSCNSKKWEFDYLEWYTEENENFSQERLNKVNKWLNEDHEEVIYTL